MQHFSDYLHQDWVASFLHKFQTGKIKYDMPLSMLWSCEKPHLSEILWDVKFNDSTGCTERISARLRAQEQCAADAFISALMQSDSTEHDSRWSLYWEYLTIEQKRDASGGAATHAAIARCEWGKSFSFLNAFGKFSKLSQI